MHHQQHLNSGTLRSARAVSTDHAICGGEVLQVPTLHNECLLGCRSALQDGEQKVLKRIMADAPDFMLKLVGELLKQGVPKETQKR